MICALFTLKYSADIVGSVLFDLIDSLSWKSVIFDVCNQDTIKQYNYYSDFE